MKKRIISLLMALLMLTSLLPTAVWAEGDAPEQTAAAAMDDGGAEQEQEPAATPETPETPEAPEAPVEPEQPAAPEIPETPETPAIPEEPEVPTVPQTPADETQGEDEGIRVEASSGQCGADVYWSLDDNGTLTIWGTGPMTNFTYTDNDESNRPWHSERESIRKVVIEEGVTSIGNFAFSFCNVGEVTIPSTVTSIGRRAFMGTPLSSVVIPEGVKTIGENAFWRCTSLQTITVPASATKFGDHAFDTREYYDGSYHTQLTDIYYGGSRQQWYDAGGGNAALTDVTVHFNGTTGNIIDGGQCGANAFWKLDRDYTLTIYGTGAMWNGDDGWYGFCDVLDQADEVTSVVVESGVTSIAYEAFRWLESMTSVTIPKTVTSIGCSAFLVGCDALTTIKYDGTTSQWKKISSTLSLPLATKVVCSNGTVTPALSGKCGKNVSYSISDDGVLTISGNGAMNNFTYKDDDSSDCPWHGVRYAIKKIVVKEGVTSIGSCAFSFDVHVTDVTLPSSLKTIGNDAFLGCHGLTSVVIPEGVTSIGAYAFERCTSIETITVPASTTELGNHAFDTREYYDGSYHTQLTDIYYGGSRQQWYDAGGGDAALTDVTVHFNGTTGDIIDGGQCGANLTWTLNGGVLTISGKGKMADYTYNNDSSDCPWQPVRYAIRKVVIENGVTHIGSDAFAYNINVTSIAIPGSVTSIGAGAFNGCEGLESAFIPGTVKEIGKGAFYCHENASLKTIYFSGTESQWNTLSQNIGLPDGVNIEYVKLGIITSGGAEPNVGDMQALYESLTGQKDLIYKQQKAADVNQDGEIDVYDLQRLYEAVNRINPL